MSKETFSRRDFIKTLGVAAGGALLAGCTPASKAKDTIERIITPANMPKETVSPTLTPASSKTPLPSETSSSISTLTPECKPLGLTDEARQFLAGHEVKKGDTSRSVILMTYDDLGSRDNIDKILDAYKYFGAKATFFLNGGYSRDGITLKSYAPEIQRIVAEGHVFGCHGLLHDALPTYENLPEGMNQLRNDIEQWLSIVQKIIPGYQIKWFRFPFGDGDDRTRKIFAEYGLQSVLWSLESGGEDKGTYERVIDKASNGEIVLSHSPRYYDTFYAHSIIENLLSRGFSLESVETGLKTGDYLPPNLNPQSCR